MNHSFAHVALLEEFNTFDALAGDGHLLEGFGVHEVVAHVVFVEELVGTTLDAYFFHFHTGVPGFVQNAAGFDIAELGADESRAFAGFYVKEFFDEVVCAVDVEAHAIFKICSCCHKDGICRYVCCRFLSSSRKITQL